MSMTKPMADLPPEIPVFPLPGVLLLPRGKLPLNIFEPRYLSMVEDALKSARMIGMIQPRDPQAELSGDDVELFDVGCAGRITSFEETDDGRYLITLTGVSRFRTAREIPLRRGYRVIAPEWRGFENDLETPGCLGIDRARLKELLGGYFDMHNLSCDWDAIDGVDDDRLMTCLSMVCPLEPGEKQALLEESCCKKRAGLFLTMLEMAVRSEGSCGGGCHCH